MQDSKVQGSYLAVDYSSVQSKIQGVVHVNYMGQCRGNTGGSACRRTLNAGQCSAGELSGGGGAGEM